jgi:hypothetical protein
MRRRALLTTKILAVTAALAACSKEQPPAETTNAIVTQTPTPQTTAESVSTAAETVANNPPPNAKEDPRLVALAEELVSAERKQVESNVKHFRPLCDKDGYPLVGNLNRKTPNYDVSTFCSEIRSKKLS